MKRLRYFIFLLAAVIGLTLVLAAHNYYKGFCKPGINNFSVVKYLDEPELARITGKAIELKKFEAGKNFSKKIIFLVDMSLPSGKNRFFVYDIPGDSIMKASLVAHGSGNNGFSFTPKFSNRAESSCTALGKYKIGKRYSGRFGTAYKLFGLDSTNSNAFKRNIVLHSYNCVPLEETYPLPICNSRGCPMVSPAFLKQLQTIIDKSEVPVLLWIFN